MAGGVDHERSARPRAAVANNMLSLRCGPSTRTFAATAKSGDSRTHSVRTNRTYAVAAIADAAFLRACSRFIVAMQRTSPKQPLKSEIKCQIQTTLSLRVGLVSQERLDSPWSVSSFWTRY